MNNSSIYFFNKCQELLHRKTFDSYRVNLNNPITIFHELEKCIEKFDKKRIKHFDPTISTLGEEAKQYLDSVHVDGIVSFGSFSKKQSSDILESTCIKNRDGKKNRTLKLLCKTICHENFDFKEKLLSKIEILLLEDEDSNFENIDVYTSWLLSQLLFESYSRKYIKDRINKCRIVINNGIALDRSFSTLKGYFSNTDDEYEALFKIKRNFVEPIKIASNSIIELQTFPAEFNESEYINDKFKTKSEGETFFSVKVNCLDFWSGLSKAHQIISESIEINVLHYSDSYISLENQALIIHSVSRRIRMESLIEKLDGFYNYKEREFEQFTDNYKRLEEGSVAREKLRSAIRFFKLGNDSLEIEHKILNYWIGFEQLFSSVDSNEDTISRIKTFFISINAVFYWQRKVNYLINNLTRFNKIATIEDFKVESPDLIGIPNLLINNRIGIYKTQLNDNRHLKAALEKHIKKLDQHLTRIYRVRNELVHEGKTSIELFLLAGHLRHYLLFSIEQLTNELAENSNLNHLDDVFVYFENLLTRIKNSQNIQEIFQIKSYNGFME